MIFDHSGNDEAIKDRMMTCIDMAELASGTRCVSHLLQSIKQYFLRQYDYDRRETAK